MWDDIEFSHEWVMSRLPLVTKAAMEQRVVGFWIDSEFELSYYYLVSGACLPLALEYAGTAKEESYVTLINLCYTTLL